MACNFRFSSSWQGQRRDLEGEPSTYEAVTPQPSSNLPTHNIPLCEKVFERPTFQHEFFNPDTLRRVTHNLSVGFRAKQQKAQGWVLFSVLSLTSGVRLTWLMVRVGRNEGDLFLSTADFKPFHTTDSAFRSSWHTSSAFVLFDRSDPDKGERKKKQPPNWTWSLSTKLHRAMW